MKSFRKWVSVVLAAVGLCGAAQAQIDIANLGGRLGAGYSYGAELSSMFSVRGNRIEADLGASLVSTSNHGWVQVHLVGLYQFSWPIADHLSWYAGVGGDFGFYSGNKGDYTGIGFGVVGQLGVEYNFESPWQLTFDLRPEAALFGRTGPDVTVGLGLRYRFE